MRYVIRADASQSIGSGHVMRCSAIAEELISRGENVIFIGKISGLDWVGQRISQLGFSEIHETVNYFSPNPELDVLILDSYTIDVDNPFLNPKNWCTVVSIVDHVTPKYKCNLRVHPGLGNNWNQDKDIPMLSGPKYIPLRKTITPIDPKLHSASTIPTIVITAGGSDAFGLVATLANFLMESELDFKAYLFTNSISNGKLDHRFVIEPIGGNLDSIAETADLVFTTASTSSIEFIARGLPVGIICAIENQEVNYSILGELGLSAQLGTRKTDGSWDIDWGLVQKLIFSLEFRLELASKGRNMIDLNGARRIVDRIKLL